jgi:hypothetical protein
VRSKYEVCTAIHLYFMLFRDTHCEVYRCTAEVDVDIHSGQCCYVHAVQVSFRVLQSDFRGLESLWSWQLISTGTDAVHMILIYLHIYSKLVYMYNIV